ncbi:MAG: cytochrome P450 [Myxococcales bacterium]|nr:cytochrome P450 [Myxococcales bacterium]
MSTGHVFSRRFENVPLRGPRRLPIVGWRGNLLRFFAKPYEGLLELARYGQLVVIADCHPGFICAFGPEHNRQLLTERTVFDPFVTLLSAPPDSPLMRLSENPFLRSGDEHRAHRRMLVPPFHRQRIARYRNAIVEHIDRDLTGWRPGARVEATTMMQRYTLGVMMRVVFGVDERRSAAEVESFRLLLGGLLEALGSLGAMVFPVDLPGTPYRRLQSLAQRFVEAVTDLIEARRACPKVDVLSDLIASRAEHDLPADAVLGQLFSLLTAGHETTYAALSWTLMLLAAHPDVLGQLYDELHAELGGDPPTLDQLRHLPFLQNVIRESLRILPTAPYGARSARHPTTLGDVHLPQGSVVVFSALITQHMPELFTAPWRFDPRRWETIDPGPYAYLPFGAGPRTCIGADFAFLEMQLTLATLLQRAWPSLCPWTQIDARLRVTLRPHPGLPLVLVRAGSRLPRTTLRGSVTRVVRPPEC